MYLCACVCVCVYVRACVWVGELKCGFVNKNVSEKERKLHLWLCVRDGLSVS